MVRSKFSFSEIHAHIAAIINCYLEAVAITSATPLSLSLSLRFLIPVHLKLRAPKPLPLHRLSPTPSIFPRALDICPMLRKRSSPRYRNNQRSRG